MGDPNPTMIANGAGSAADDELVRLLKEQIAVRQQRVAELRARLGEVEPELKRYQRVLAQLTGTSPSPGRRPGPKPRNPSAAPARDQPARVGDERLATIKQTIIDYARDHDEFRQVDIRTVSGISSSIMAVAFEALRQDNVIRLARSEGNNKWFRLTRETARELEPKA